MTSIKLWGPVVWNLFHAIAEQIKEDKFSELSNQLFQLIIRICNHLPCPDCSMHSKNYLARVNFSLIKTKEQFRHFIWTFHNVVNQRKQKPQFDPIYLKEMYGQKSLIQCFNEFINVYKTQGNMKLMADSFQRKLIVDDLKKWMMKNLVFFERSSPPYPSPSPSPST
jgi:hypothetical protein